MGIDVWFERPAADALALRKVEDASPAHPARDLSPAAVRPPERSPVPVRDPRSRVRQAAPGTRDSGTGEAPAGAPAEPPSEASSPAFAPFSLLFFKGTGVVLVSAAPVPRKRQRLGHDIVEAVELLAGSGPVKTQAVEFVYPPNSRAEASLRAADPGVGRAPSPTPPDRVLRAFLGRQFSTMASPRILICADAARHFEGWFTGAHRIIPSLDDLVGDAARKRTLWQELQDG